MHCSCLYCTILDILRVRTFSFAVNKKLTKNQFTTINKKTSYYNVRNCRIGLSNSYTLGWRKF